MSLDDNDINILHALQTNGRLSFRQISEKVKISVPTVSNKVNSMEKLGVIRGYRADLDPERLGELSAVVTIKAKPADLVQIGEKFENDPQVRQMFHLSSGRLLLICTFVDAHLINEFATRLGSVSEISEYEIANVINVAKEEERAVVANGLNVIVQCSQCGREMRDQPMRLRENGREVYLCSPACMNAFQARNGPGGG
ncbi:winged helix-turn-helix transcriptional regulator [Methanomassiliicoccus luminyensis]|uniref:winged helix-turn-helix transcriptional regulator n=1 Tax=Methanomassiliicoccus luminyensis TaxID=1080712 RepID=UPI000360B3F5|nr:winged helix-turn-helix transcriptional regulator [Methanomassiliicoccus luminyensis]